MGYSDPDGAAHEVILQRPGFSDSDMLERADWTTVTLDSPPPQRAAHSNSQSVAPHGSERLVSGQDTPGADDRR